MRKIIFPVLLLVSNMCFSQPAKMLESAESGYEWSQLRIGLMFEHGDEGAVQNDAEAVKWYRRAAEQGNDLAQVNLAVMIAQGRGVPKNDAEAVKWYRLAAEQGNAKAQSNIGAMTEYGRGVPKNDAESVKWYQRAAQQGEEIGQYNLAMMLIKGRGVPQSDEKAYFWLLLAGTKLEDARKTRDLLQKLLSQSQVTKLQAQATAWKPKRE